MKKKKPIKANWLESDVENQTSQLDVVKNIDIYTYEEQDVIVLDPTSSNDEFASPSDHFTSHIEPTNKRKILHDVDDNQEVKKSRTVSRHSNLLFNGKYLTIISQTPTSITAKCMSCGKNVKGYATVTSNFITHFRTVGRMNLKFK